MKKYTAFESSTGLTLVELLVTLSILGIILMYATGNDSGVKQRQQVDAASQALADSIQYGQDYARHLTVSTALCAGSPEDNCLSEDWTKGWTLFQSNSQNPSAAIQAVRFFQPDTTGLNIQFENITSKSKIVINGEGFIDNLDDAKGIVTICNAYQPYHSTLELNKANINNNASFDITTRSENCKNEAT